VSPVRAPFFDSDADSVKYDIQVLFNSVKAGTIQTMDDAHSLFKMVSQNGSHKFCPGLQY